MRGLFVSGTDTGAGKTVLCAALVAASQARYHKPVQTGPAEDHDTPAVARLSGADPGRLLPPAACFPLPASPHHAAAVAGTRLELAALSSPLRAADRPGDRWVVEGAGGLLVPLNETVLMTDLIAALGLPVLLAASTRLGAINHSLLSLRALRALGLPGLGIVLLGDADPSLSSALDAFAPGAVLGRIPWLDPLAAAPLRAAGRALLDVESIAACLC